MKYEHSSKALALIFLAAGGAFVQAAPVTYTVNQASVSYTISNSGTTYNDGFKLNGPNVALSGGDSSFFGPYTESAGTPFQLIFPLANSGYGNGTGTVGGVVYQAPPGQVALTLVGGTIGAQNVIIPVGATNPTVTVPASLFGTIGGCDQACTTLGTGTTFTLDLGNASGLLTVSFAQAAGLGGGTPQYYPTGATFTTTPEPATLVGTLLGLALLAVVKVRRTKLSLTHLQ